MIDPAAGPFLFDTSAEGWLARGNGDTTAWLRRYLRIHSVSVSAATVIERVRGYSTLWRRAVPEARTGVEAARVAYLSRLANVLPIDAAVAIVAGEIMALVPDPPTPPRRSHRLAESRQDRLARLRFDGIVAATALVNGMPLIHNNAADFEAIRGAIETDPDDSRASARWNSSAAPCWREHGDGFRRRGVGFGFERIVGVVAERTPSASGVCL